MRRAMLAVFEIRHVAVIVATASLCAMCRSPPVSPAGESVANGAPTPKWGMAIHTGAGSFTLASLADREQPMRTAMAEALRAGHRVLAAGGASLDAVEAAIVILEDSPLFNAGKGAVFTHEGTNELDSSIMDGRTHSAGAVAGLKHIRNPIRLARMVMERSPHVMMVGEGAEAFAKEQGVELVPQSYFYTERAWQQHERLLKQEQEQAADKKASALPMGSDREAYYGTVGAVALDQQGNLAAGTSTGGLTNKRFGRVGDSPIIGAGTYASNASCAVSATGTGEFFIRFTVARDICARVEYQSASMQAAADAVVQGVLKEAKGDGGVIALDREGNFAASFNTNGMGRGYIDAKGEPAITFFRP